MNTDNQNNTENFDKTWLDAQLENIGREDDKVVAHLQAIQKKYNYLPQDALIYLCENSGITPSSVTSISTFYPQFRNTPGGRHNINVCVGTACHVKGAEDVYNEFKRHLCIDDTNDTDPQKMFTINKVACLGCCALAVAVQIDDIIYGHVTPASARGVIKDFLSRENGDNKKNDAYKKTSVQTNEVRICLDSCCAASGAAKVVAAIKKVIDSYKLPVKIKRVGCVSICHKTPFVEIVANGVSYYYANIEPDDAQSIMLSRFRPQSFFDRVRCGINATAESILLSESKEEIKKRRQVNMSDKEFSDFFGKQKQIAIEHYGKITPLDIDEYIMSGGFDALKKCLNELNANDVINIIKDSGLRGRGGAGFPTGVKWEIVKNNASAKNVLPHNAYVICNGDEGDPGAFMDRMLLESFPYRVIEGVLIAAHTIGAKRAIFYIRTEYPLSITVIREAIDVCNKRGITNDVEIDVIEGAGAFVCGEETALIKSIEGKRPTPLLKPPYPSSCGLYNVPTLINNCETFACVPWIIKSGAAKFKTLGTQKSFGTKVFALAGKIVRGGLIETPMGITINEIVEQIGGGIANGKKMKAVQIGGPSGGCVPASLGDTPIDYESLNEIGAMMGSGGLVVLDESDCMVDIAKYFLTFTQKESCGRCVFCRVGTKQMLDILEKICAGRGTHKDLQKLEELAISIKKGSLCGLGKTAPNPVLTTLKYFREEYEAHIKGECVAGKCKELISYSISDKCEIGCTICSQNCPVGAIPFAPYTRPTIQDELCSRCGACQKVCPADAICITPKNAETKA